MQFLSTLIIFLTWIRAHHQGNCKVRLHQDKETKHRIDIWFLLLDSQATNHVFYNRKLVKNIRHCPKGLLIHGHHGSSQTHYYGEVDGIDGRVWLDPDGIKNIISQSKLSKAYCITYDNLSHGIRFFIHRKDGTAIVF